MKSSSRLGRNIAQPFTISSFHDFMTWPGFVRVWLAFTARVIISRNSQRYCDLLIMRLLVSRARSEPPSVRSN